MQFYIDTSDLEEIKKIKDEFTIDGVTTNPTLIARSGKTIQEIIPKICEIVQGPVSAEVIETKEVAMFEEALKLSKLHKHVVVKIPLIPSGLRVVRRLKKKNIKTNVTLCFSESQALMAGRAGAEMVSIFVGRLDDNHGSGSGMKVVKNTLDIFSNYNIKTKVLVASIRNKEHILESASLGADIVTAPYKILNKLIHHPLTDDGLKKFLLSAQSIKK